MQRNELNPLQTFLNEAYQIIFGDKSGAPAGYIPELAVVNPDQFGIAITTSDGYTHEVGDTTTEFTIQSISKAFIYSLALEMLGPDEVLKTIGIEPSGEAFNSIRLNDNNQPFNPMVNSGAIACTALICQKYGKRAFDQIQETLGGFAGRQLDLDERVFSSENLTGDRNRAIGWLLKNNKNFDCDVEEVLEVYFKQCSILVTAKDLSIMAATLSKNGINPVSKSKIIGNTTAIQTMSVMVSSGMYDYSGEWTYKVGLPAKSGVGGGITAVLPSQFGLGVFSPPLDQLGNSVRGIKVCQLVSTRFNLHVLEIEDDVAENMPISYDLSAIRSSRARSTYDNEILTEFGPRAWVLELSGVINFSGSDFITRSIVEAENKDFIILSFKRVSHLTTGALELFRVFFEKVRLKDCQIILSDTTYAEDTTLSLFGIISELIEAHSICFGNLDQAIEWVEDQLVTKYSTNRYKGDGLISLTDQPLLRDLTDVEMLLIQENLIMTEYESGSKIITAGDAPDGIYLLQDGQVNVMIGDSTHIAGLNAGTCFGELALLSPDEPRTADIVAKTKTNCAFLSIEAFQKISSINAQINALILRNLSLLLFERLKQSNSKIATLSKN